MHFRYIHTLQSLKQKACLSFSIRIKEEIVDSIDSISNQTGHSRNELIGIFLEYAVKNCKIEE